MAQVLGIIDLYWLGQKLDIKPGGSFNLGGVVNGEVVYGRSVGRGQKMMASEINADVIIKSGMRVSDVLNKTVEGEIQVKADTGQTFVWSDAFIKDAPSITAGDSGGSAKVTWGAGSPVEI